VSVPPSTFYKCVVDCVCCGVFSSRDLCVPRAAYSDALWRFSVPMRKWIRVDETRSLMMLMIDYAQFGHVSPLGRYRHAMAHLGVDLWVHGGKSDSNSGMTGEGLSESYLRRAPLLLLLH
jgi:hypothetical protein